MVLGIFLIFIAWVGIGDFIKEQYNQFSVLFKENPYGSCDYARLRMQVREALYDGAIDFKNPQVKEAYRFCWDHSLGPIFLIAVTVEDEQARLNFRIPNYVESENNTSISIKENEILLTKEQIQKLRKTVNDNPFWKERIPRHLGIDGVDWIIEVRQNGKYHKDYQWYPEEGSIRNIALCLLELSQLDPNDVY